MTVQPLGRSRAGLLAALLPLLAACDHGPSEPIVPDAIIVPDVAATLEPADSIALTASYVVGGAALPSDEGLRWYSTNPESFSVDSVTGRGQAHRALLAGTAAIRVPVIAQSGGVSATTVVIVIPAVDRIALVLSRSAVAGRTMTPVVLAYEDHIAHPWPYQLPPETGAPQLRSTDPTIVSVEADGQLRARAVGTAWITATLRRAVSDSTPVTVRSTGFPLTFIAVTDSIAFTEVNDAGEVAGNVTDKAGPRGVVLRQGTRIDIPACVPVAMNNAGQIACRNGALYDHGTLTNPPVEVAWASGLTESGNVFGARRVNDGSPAYGYHALLWTGATVTQYPDPSCCFRVRSTGKVNALGHGVGINDQMYWRPLLLKPDGPVDVGSAGGRYATPLAINDADDMVGSSENQSGGGTAAVWLAAAQWRGQIIGPRASTANGISEGGLVVGNGGDGAFVWKDGRYSRLADLVAEPGWQITSAPGISRGGRIVARGVSPSGQRGILLIDTPFAP